MKRLQMLYHKSAEDSDFGWENQSLPIGNGYMGANIFGIVERERIQITENSLVNDYNTGGLNNFAEIYLKFDHKNASGYERGLILDDAISFVRYTCDEVEYRREYFASYPDKVLVMKLTASKKSALSFEIAPVIPFIKNYAKEENDGGGKSGTVFAEQDTITLRGKMFLNNVLFEGQLKVLSNTGRTIAKENSILIEGSDEVILIMAVGTNYELTPRVFTEDDRKKKLDDIPPHEKVSRIILEASRPYQQLLENHLNDFQGLFKRVDLDIQGEDYSGYDTGELLKMSREKTVPYLEVLYFQYGRYLLISSSRKGCLPCNLQGIWNCHDMSPWGSGYWHNINIQMNYWPAFNTNLFETFESYVDFYKAYLLKAQEYADVYIKKHNPENFADQTGENGWTIGTGSYPYNISAPGGHSGPGTGGLTTKLFWDYYDFTRDGEILKDVTYPALLGMSKFLTKTVKNYDGAYLASFSASPEQMLNGTYISGGSYYQTVGCAFDQQMIYENGNDLLKAAGILQIENDDIKKQEEQMDTYCAVNIGWSGQIKEYLEEKFYGEVGQYMHRHISQLVGLYPGTQITSETDAWMDAAKFTLNERGDQSTGWALAHRINTWARTGDGNRCYKLFKELLSNKTLQNLWDTHPPFQIDGNFGGTGGIAEMLLQSHEEYISILPALPDAWEKGRYSGLTARGGFEISVQWDNLSAKYIKVLSRKGEVLKLKYPNISKAKVYSNGEQVRLEVMKDDKIVIHTTPAAVYEIENLEDVIRIEPPQNLTVDCKEMQLSWEGPEDATYKVYRAFDSEPKYTQIAQQLTNNNYRDNIDFSKYETVTYRVTACMDGNESTGIFKTINHATQLEIDMHINHLKGRKQLP